MMWSRSVKTVDSGPSVSPALHSGVRRTRRTTVRRMTRAIVVLGARVAVGELAVWQIAPPAPPVGGALPAFEPDLRIAAGPGIRRLIAGDITSDQAISGGVVHVVEGDGALLERFALTFHIDSGMDRVA